MPRGEFELIAALRDLLPAPSGRVEVGSGDDCAVVRAGGDRAVTSVDATVDGVHARLDLGDRLEAAEAFGWRALMTALSDLAACGAPAGEAYIALLAALEASDDLLLAIGRGLAAAAAETGTSVVGGDVTAAPVTAVTATVTGWLAQNESPLTRAGARPGDRIALTGAIGAAAAGLALTLGEAQDGDVGDGGDAARLRQAHLRPRARLREGADLRAAGASAAIDLSDGLLADASHVARASGVDVVITPADVPLAAGVPSVAAAVGADSALRFAQGGGEDFELLVAVPPGRIDAAERAVDLIWIGEATPPDDAASPSVRGLPRGRAGHDHRRR